MRTTQVMEKASGTETFLQWKLLNLEELQLLLGKSFLVFNYFINRIYISL